MAADKLEPKWYVYYHNFNKSEIQKFNIFDHWKFKDDVFNDLYKCKNKGEFAKKLKSNLFYYFCSKCEWEVLICPWVESKEKGIIKIDVYDQIVMNWEIFLNHVWSYRKEVRSGRKKNPD